MSSRAITNRRVLHNITNMEDHEDELSSEKASGGIDGIGDEKGGQADPTLTAASTIVSSVSVSSAEKTVSLSAGKNIDSRCTIDESSRHNQKPFIRRCGKFESGSGSGDQDGMHTEDGVDIAAKKRKTRRGKPKHRKLKPYSKQHLSYQQRVRNRAGRPTKTGRQPPAPYNTTQFLIEDHNDLPDLEQKLASASASSEIPRYLQKPGACRTRDSSFSVDSDEDFFYSSPEDEEEFLTKEFKTAYEDLHAERLGSMTKAQLIQEYIQLEAKVDLLTKRLKGKSLYPTEEKDSESRNGASADVETAKKLKTFQQKIDDLIQQNEQLRRENESLRAQRHKSVSVDSESESDSSSNENHSRGNGSQRSPGSSPVPVSYQGRLDKSHRQNSSISSVDSESDSSSSSESGPTDGNGSPKSSVEVNGNASAREIEGLPT